VTRAYLDRLRTDPQQPLRCQHPGCQSLADVAHHLLRRSSGGTDDAENLLPLCFYHHHRAHADDGDWQRWGRRGGLATARQPSNWMHNLTWARQMKREAPELWEQHLAYYQGRRDDKPPTLSDWRREARENNPPASIKGGNGL